MQLVLLDEERGLIVARYGEFTPEPAEAFFAEALSALQFQKEFPEAVVQNEIHLLQLAGTLSQMGLLQGDPDAIQQWMRPYIENELVRRKERTDLYARATKAVGMYYDRLWGWIPSGLWDKALSAIQWLIRFLTKKKLSLLLFFLPSNLS